MQSDKASSVASVKTVSVGNTKMDYAVFGRGEKVFVILPGMSVHSVMRSAKTIANAYKDFWEEYTVYVFDRVKDISKGYTVENMADDTAEAMKKLNIENADIFGASQGGMIALCLAINHPKAVHKMILGSTFAKPNDTCIRVLEEWIQNAKEKNEKALLESFACNVYSETTFNLFREALISLNSGIDNEEYARFIILAEACKNFDCLEKLFAVRCPVLVIGSEGDRVATAEGSKQIAEALGCELFLYGKNYGHGVYDEAPDYKQRCLNFFRGQSALKA